VANEGRSFMKSVTYNIKLKRSEGTWSASCQDPMLPGFDRYRTPEDVLRSVYNTIFDDLKKENQKNPIAGPFELRVNIIDESK